MEPGHWVSLSWLNESIFSQLGSIHYFMLCHLPSLYFCLCVCLLLCLFGLSLMPLSGSVHIHLSLSLSLSLSLYQSFLIIHLLPRRGQYTVLAPSICNQNFHHIFLSNHASQSLQTWCSASARGPTCGLPNSCLPVIYFLFYDLFYFLI